MRPFLCIKIKEKLCGFRQMSYFASILSVFTVIKNTCFKFILFSYHCAIGCEIIGH